MKMMTFYLAGETYAIALSSVASVVRGGAGSDDGQRPLVELAALLGVAERPGQDAPLLVLRGADGREARVRVERLGEVVEVGDAAVRGVPRYFEAPLLEGVAQLVEGLAVVLNPAVLIEEATSAGLAGAGATRERP
jgi:chemotaxis signal transduction protein